jgi:putative aldouronate transport system substrate-binding protein
MSDYPGYRDLIKVLGDNFQGESKSINEKVKGGKTMVTRVTRYLRMVLFFFLVLLAFASGIPQDVKAANRQAFTDIEVWYPNSLGKQPIDKGSKLYNFYKEKIGVGIIHPFVDWNGGTTYLNTLNMRIASKEMPDLFVPWGGIEVALAKQGALANLTKLLPKYAPILWKAIPKDVWKTVKAQDPTDKGQIYFVPQIVNYGMNGALIRKDWLNKLGLKIPTTKDEFVAVLRAFRDKDPNGNGKKDELPMVGRENGRWMDILFGMYGVAMDEGFPEWDLYNKKLTYAAITPNMKAALKFCSQLYKEGLLDPETFLNSKNIFDAKVKSDRVGCFYHQPEYLASRFLPIYQKNHEARLVSMPVPKVAKYKGFITMKRIRRTAYWVVENNKDRAKLIASLKVLNALADPKLQYALYLLKSRINYNYEI